MFCSLCSFFIVFSLFLIFCFLLSNFKCIKSSLVNSFLYSLGYNIFLLLFISSVLSFSDNSELSESFLIGKILPENIYVKNVKKVWKMWKKCEKCEKNVKNVKKMWKMWKKCEKKIWIKYNPDLNSINYVKIMQKKYYIICENII